MKTILLIAVLFLAAFGSSQAQAYDGGGHHSYYKNHRRFVWVPGHKIWRHGHKIWVPGHYERVR